MILQVAVNKPLYTLFDYLPPKGVDISQLSLGIRVRVPFGRLKLVGILLAITDSSNVPTNKLKAAEEILDTTPLLSEQNLKLLHWVAHYYHHPIGEVIAASLPSALLKKGVAAEIKKFPERNLTEKTNPLQLNSAQAKVVEQVKNNLEQFYPCLLDGVTGSGKTEVYLQIIQKVLEQGKQALVLVPEINLTPQIIQRFEQACAVPIAVWHSKLTAKQRLDTWLLAREGLVSIIIGTRSAVWIPLSNIGVFIVDEEHDLSYKQQSSFRYSARDVAIVRAKQAGVPILLGTATPSLDSLYNALQQRYQHFVLPERAGAAIHPSFHIVDMRQQKNALSPQLKKAIKQRLKKRQQVLLFINRRGYAPTLTCYNCGWVATCKNCDANLTYHSNNQRLNCHHCGASHLMYSQCPSCQYLKLSLLGQGTERIEENLEQ
ncbi:replication restart helicase PriA, partial [Candidatus Marithrix sp. Canyon 246]